eukprot:SAG11_NODE_2135_length_3772_cov_6.006534_1_plen_230_part_00
MCAFGAVVGAVVALLRATRKDRCVLAAVPPGCVCALGAIAVCVCGWRATLSGCSCVCLKGMCCSHACDSLSGAESGRSVWLPVSPAALAAQACGADTGTAASCSHACADLLVPWHEQCGNPEQAPALERQYSACLQTLGRDPCQVRLPSRAGHSRPQLTAVSSVVVSITSSTASTHHHLAISSTTASTHHHHQRFSPLPTATAGDHRRTAELYRGTSNLQQRKTCVLPC